MAKRFSAPEYEEKAKEIVSGGYGYYDREKKEAFYVPKHRQSPDVDTQSSPLSPGNRDSRAPFLKRCLRLFRRALAGRSHC